MIKKKARPVLTDLEVGSFSDISFLLIIFFILTTQIVRLQGKIVDIPAGETEKSEEKKKEEKKQITVHLLKGNTVQISAGDKAVPVSLEELKVKLMQENYPARPNPEDRFVIVEAQQEVSYDLYFKVLMMIDDAGGQLALMDSGSGGSEGESSDGKAKAADGEKKGDA